MRRHSRQPRGIRAWAALGPLLVASLLGCSSESATGNADQSTSTPAPSPAILRVDRGTLDLLLGEWSPTPIAISPEAIAVADQVCRDTRPERLADHRLMVVDARGNGLLNAFYVGVPGGNYACENLSIDPLGALLPEGFGSGTDPSEAVPTPGPNAVVAWYGTHQEAPRSMMTFAGPIGSNIVDVRFTADGRPPIVATVMNGWFAAWWPDDWPRLTLRGYDARGIEVLASLDW